MTDIKQFPVLLYPEDLAFLKKIAKQNGASAGEIVRRMIRAEKERLHSGKVQS